MKKIKLLFLALLMLGLNPMQSQSIYDALDQFENQCELIMPNRVAPGQNIEVTFVSDAKLLPAGQALTLLITNAQGEPVIERLSSLTPQSTPLYSGTTFTDVLISQEGTYSAVVVAPNGNAVAEKSLMVRDGAYTVKPLFELFTSSTCGPCASANPVIDAVLAQNIGNHSIIKYQVDFPGAGDPYCNADVGIRRAFYPAVTGVPALIPNGNNGNPTTPHVMSQGFYDSFQGLPTDMQIVVTEAEIDDNNMVSVNLSIDVAETYAEGLKLHIAIIEKTTVGNVGSNGEVEFHNVMMKMLPDGNGTTLPALNPGTPYTMSQTYDMDLTFMEDANDLEVVVFVQNSADKSIVQSEMVPVGSELDSYAITFNIKDESNNAIQGATIFMENQGTRTTNSTGVAIYNDVLPGSYDYEIEAAGFNSISGTATVDNNDVNIDIVMESPGFYFYEDFTDAPAMGIPDGWASIASASDFVYCTGGEAILFRQNSAMNPLILISPLIDLEPAEHITFDFGKGQGAVEAILGYMTDPEDAETFVDVETFNPTAAWDEFVLDVSSINGGMGEVYLAWKLTSGVTTYFSLDNVALTHKGGDDQTYSVTFNVKDNAENPLSGAAVTLQGHGTKQTNASGLALFEEVEPGTYSYQIIAAGFVTANDEVEVVNADVTENVQMQLPGYYYLEDFSEHPDYDVPEDWTKIVTPSDMVYCAGGAAILFRQSGAMNPIILASPLIDLEPAGELMFDYGDGSGAEGEFGYMIDLSDPESFVTVSEFSPSSSWKSDTISVSNINGGNGAVYLAWRITSGMFTYFSLDDVRLTYKGDEEAPLFFDDFENYNDGEKVACQNPDEWTTWSNNPCGSDDAYISSAQAYSGTQSVKIDGDADLIKPFSSITEGSYTISFQMYVPQSKYGYFNILQNFDGSNSKWGMEAYFRPTGTGTLYAAGEEVEFNFAVGQWFEMRIDINLNSDEAQLFHNNTLVNAWQWSVGAQGNDDLCQLGAIGFYAWGQEGDPLYYFDDFRVDLKPSLAPPTNLVAEVIDNKNVKLTWEAPYKGLKGYNVYRKGQIIAENIPNTTYTDYNLTPGKYTYVVRALYDEGLSLGAGPVTATIEGGTERNFVVLEIATGTWCGFCPGAAMGANDLIEQGYDVAVIKYHSGDPFENTFSSSRINYYDVGGYPTAIFDGIEVKSGGSASSSLFNTYLPYYENRMEVVSYFTLDASVVNTSDNHWTVTVDTEMIYPSANKNLALHVAITESHIDHSWLNQTEINNTVRLMVPNALGTALNFDDSQAHQVVLDFDLDQEYDVENCELIVFLQDLTTKEIYQAAKAVMEPITGVDTHDQMITNIYPNPASGYVNVVTSEQNAVLKVVDIQGRVVLTKQINSTNQQIDISRFNSGLYLFMVTTELSTYTQKVIVK